MQAAPDEAHNDGVEYWWRHGEIAQNLVLAVDACPECVIHLRVAVVAAHVPEACHDVLENVVVYVGCLHRVANRVGRGVAKSSVVPERPTDTVDIEEMSLRREFVQGREDLLSCEISRDSKYDDRLTAAVHIPSLPDRALIETNQHSSAPPYRRRRDETELGTHSGRMFTRQKLGYHFVDRQHLVVGVRQAEGVS